MLTVLNIKIIQYCFLQYLASSVPIRIDRLFRRNRSFRDCLLGIPKPLEDHHFVMATRSFRTLKCKKPDNRTL